MVLLLEVVEGFCGILQFVVCSFEIISKTELNLLGDKLSPVIKHGFLRSEENVNLNMFQHLMVYESWCGVQFYGHYDVHCP